jgi:hypothetical protein
VSSNTGGTMTTHGLKQEHTIPHLSIILEAVSQLVELSHRYLCSRLSHSHLWKNLKFLQSFCFENITTRQITTTATPRLRNQSSNTCLGEAKRLFLRWLVMALGKHQLDGDSTSMTKVLTRQQVPYFRCNTYN